jgi:hypothetical protein
MHNPPPRPSSSKTVIATIFASLIIFLAVSVAAQPQNQSDWKQWTANDIQRILFKSPWVATYCQEWDTGDTVSATAGYSASIVSSLTVRQALVRRMELDNRYDKLDFARRLEVDQRVDACLNKTFDEYIVLSFSDLGNPQIASRDTDKSLASNIYIVTSDGRKISGHVALESVAMTCGAFPQDSDLSSLRTNPRILPPFGPGKEVAFPRFVDGKPTVGPEDKSIRVHSGCRSQYPTGHPEIDFNIAKLIYQGKPDF